jgi:hypothetical protein
LVLMASLMPEQPQQPVADTAEQEAVSALAEAADIEPQ